MAQILEKAMPTWVNGWMLFNGLELVCSYESSLTRWFTLGLTFSCLTKWRLWEGVSHASRVPRLLTISISSPSVFHQTAYWLSIFTSVYLSPISPGPDFQYLSNSAIHLSLPSVYPEIYSVQSKQGHFCDHTNLACWLSSYINVCLRLPYITRIRFLTAFQ